MIKGAPTRSSISIFIFSIILGSFQPVFASVGEQIRPFLKSIEQSPYDFEFLVKGLKSVHQVRFKKGVIGSYEGLLNRMNLGPTMDDGTNRIKTVQALNSGDFATLLHEAFHAFKENFIDDEKRYVSMKRWMELRADNLLHKLPRNKRDVALEEAYSVFVGNLAMSYHSIEYILNKYGKEDGCYKRLGLAKELWEKSWNQKITGYYYRDSIGEYWADKARALKILATQGREAYQKYINRDRAIYIDQSITRVDKKWISKFVFQNRFVKSFEDSFPQYQCNEPSS
jgi:hypothetical protein